MRRKRILVFSEGSLMTTGYGVYTRNLMTQLAKSDKYEIAELGGYIVQNDQRIKELGWKVFANVPTDPELRKQFDYRPSSQWGEFVLDGVCLDYKPDIIIFYRDIWCEECLLISPSRPFVKLIHAAQVDSIPQKPQWLHIFSQFDKVSAYTDWGLNAIKEQGCGNINITKAVGAGVDTNHFKPLDTKACRKSLGIPEDSFVILSCMRNQVRKLWFDALQCFKRFLEEAPAPIAAKAYLYCHSRQPDLTYNFGELIRELGVGHRVFFNYVCGKCRAVFASLFRGEKAICTACGEHAAEMPGIINGISPNVYAFVFNSADIYLQYSVSEGFGMSMPEAAACKIPVMAVDYSAMGEVSRKLNGIQIKVQRMFREQNVCADRAYPDNDDCVAKLIQYARLPQEMRLKYKNAALDGVLKNYTWEIVAKNWMDIIDETDYGSWDAPINIHSIPNTPPPNCSNEDFIRWGFERVANRPNLIRTRFFDEMLSDLNNGFCESNKESFDREKAFKILAGWGEMKNNFEKQRCGG